ncbi:MAG TPA: SpoIID/LytB domain-containing protein [Candidatus Paceibacterota bacterium]|nr:SpoIID/LytB domain-containing protein [Verrucomicrobiota bacterium]HSA12489.1 SpoIID/LytB domain-containing protein [Candidatus Paceibacterota bacterium]
MIHEEPLLSVGIYQREAETRGVLNGRFVLPDKTAISGEFAVRPSEGRLVLTGSEGRELARGPEIRLVPEGNATFTLRGVTIGINFHWERKEDETFEGGLRLLPNADGTITAINDAGVEQYLKSVISSEMSATAPLELLRAHAITSRSWLVAMLERQKRFKNVGGPARRGRETADEIVRWYDREDHQLFDVCADDHCQRYHGITKIISPAAAQAVQDTRGVFLVHDGGICDARYSKSCGGRSEKFASAWEDVSVPYLESVSDAAAEHPLIASEEAAEQWVRSSPVAYCNTNDGDILRQVLPSFDQETTDFYRWRVAYTQEEIAALLRKRSGIDFGDVRRLEPLQRGSSGRIMRLRIVGSRRTVVVGKELEIRRWLSSSHLYSSAFVVRTDEAAGGVPAKFTLHGAGWGHGVGFCQIGAAVMAAKGFEAEAIVKHYFRGAELRKLY